MKKGLLFLLMIPVVVSCNWFQKTPLQKYEATLEKEMRVKWDSEMKKAFAEESNVSLPFSMKGMLLKNRTEAYSIDFNLAIGEVFTADVSAAIEGTKLFLQLYERTADADKPFVRVAFAKANALEHEVTSSGSYKLLIAGEVGVISGYSLAANVQPLYGFPLKGGQNSDIKSFWGAPRDGGARKHEGIDIFADKGSDLVAVTDGRIERREGGLGGKQIWLYDKERRIRIYYAHLDKQIARDGAFVEKGTVVGTVGNTGNARTTPPHVHFGTYLSKRGAVDPLGFVKLKPKPVEVKHTKLENKVFASALRDSALFVAPNSSAARKGELTEGTPFYVFAVSGDFYYVRTPGGRAGFVQTKNVHW